MSNIINLANDALHRKIAAIETHNYGGKFEILRPGVIQGHWHEDGNTYEITVPAQLQDCFLTLLNNCKDLYFAEINP